MTRRGRRASALAILAALSLLLTVAPATDAAAASGHVTRRTEPADAVSEARDYLVYTPPRLANFRARSLVVFLHGCTQTANDAMDSTPWNKLADERGFVVVYPEQSTAVDGSAARCWNSGQAPVYPRGQHELETIARITREVRGEFRIRSGRVFIAGISAGANMTGSMAATYPDLYAAMGSVVGCGYPCGEPTGVGAWNRMGPYVRLVPGFFVAGTADYLIDPAASQGGVSGWVGANDLADDGSLNGSVSHQPVVEQRGFDQAAAPSTDACVKYARNPCPAGIVGWRDYPTTVSRYLDRAGRVVVESWLLHGLSHNYPGGDANNGTFADPHGPDVTTAMYDFFVAHAR